MFTSRRELREFYRDPHYAKAVRRLNATSSLGNMKPRALLQGWAKGAIDWPEITERVPWWFRLICVFLFGPPTLFVSPFGTKRSFARRCVWPGIFWGLLFVGPAYGSGEE